MKLFALKLSDNRNQKQAEQNDRTNCVADIHRHRNQVPGCFTEGSCAYLHYPEKESNFRNFIYFIHYRSNLKLPPDNNSRPYYRYDYENIMKTHNYIEKYDYL